MFLGNALMTIIVLTFASMVVMSFADSWFGEDLVAGEEADAPLSVKLTLGNDTVKVGEDIALNVVIRNRSGETISLPKPALDVRSVSFSFGYEGASHFYTEIAEEQGRYKDLEMIKLDPHAEVSFSTTVPAVAEGAWQVRAGVSYDEKMYGSEQVAFTVAKEGKVLLVRIATNRGDMLARFYPTYSLNHVLHFVKRAKDGKYDGNVFHRVIKGFMLQGGDPDGNGTGGPGYVMPAEFNNIPHKLGVLSMARRGDPNSAGCQFFVMHGAQGHLNGQYTVFGQVVEGLDVIETIATTPTGAQDRPAEEQKMTKLTVETLAADKVPAWPHGAPTAKK